MIRRDCAVRTFFMVLIVFQTVSFIKRIHWICGNKKAASVSEGRVVSIICRMFYGFAAGAGAGLACAEPSTSKPQSPSLCSLPLFRAASTSR